MVSGGRSRLYQERQRGTTERAMHTPSMGVQLSGTAYGPGFALCGQAESLHIILGEMVGHHTGDSAYPYIGRTT